MWLVILWYIYIILRKIKSEVEWLLLGLVNSLICTQKVETNMLRFFGAAQVFEI